MRPLLRSLLKLLNFGGFDPRNNSPFRMALRVLSIISITCIILQDLSEIVFNWNGSSTLGKVYFLPVLCIGLACCLALTIDSNLFLRILNTIDLVWEPKTESYRTRIETIHKRTNIIMLCYYGNCMCCIFLIEWLPLLMGHKEMVFGGYEVCDENTFCFNMFVVWHLYAAHMHYLLPVLALDGVFIYLVAETYCAFEVLKEALDDGDFGCINDIAKQHDIILGLVRDIGDFFSTILLVRYLSSMGSFITCMYMVAFEGVPTQNHTITIKFSILFVVLLMELFIYSYGCLIIQEQSESVAYAIYSTEWYAISKPQLRRQLWFMMQRAQQYGAFLIGGAVEVNLISYLDAIRSSYSIFMMILTLDSTK